MANVELRNEATSANKRQKQSDAKQKRARNQATSSALVAVVIEIFGFKCDA